MATAYSTAGILVKYCVGAAATRPTSSYVTIPGVKVIPALGTDVNALQTTDLAQTFAHTYIDGLRDSGGSIGLTVNDYEAMRTAWGSCVSSYAAMASTSAMYWEFTAPNGSGMDSFFFKGKPVALGYGGADVDSVLENTCNILPEGGFQFASAST